MKKPKPTKAQLKHQVKEAVAMQTHTYHFADLALDKVGQAHLTGSGVFIRVNPCSLSFHNRAGRVLHQITTFDRAAVS